MTSLNFPKISDPRGNLTFLQHPLQVPFEIKRVFWTYNVPSGEIRGGHAYKNQEEIIIALSGSFDIIVTLVNGEREIITLNRSFYGVYIPSLTWRHLENFSSNAVSFHLSSSHFDENDYLRDWNKFKEFVR
jgi:oxalate decarboxylase/phosphoglucose isomerase-like protein (cupin superfamily)